MGPRGCRNRPGHTARALALAVVCALALTGLAPGARARERGGDDGVAARPAGHDAFSAQSRKKARTDEPAPAKKPAQMQGREFTEAELRAAVIPGIPDARFFADSEADLLRALPKNDAPWLALSAGGAGGAFGAGLLIGLTQAGKRPQFGVVTGVSGGALIAPYAFVGPAYDAQLREAFTAVLASDIFEAATTPTSLLDTWPLKDTIGKRITPKFLADVAAEHNRGRRLFVVTTNLDAERAVAWDMGAIAAHGGDKALKLFRDVLLASSSIPGLFPPVFFDVEANGKRFREMHADGGMGGQFYVGPDSWLAGTNSQPIPMRQLYLIVNNKITPEFSPPDKDPSLLSVLGLGIAMTVKTAARLEVIAARAAAKRNNIDFKLAVVDADFNAVSRGVIDPDFMKSLFERGLREANGPAPFLAVPPAQPSPKAAAQ
ncbi:MAG: patatin-like phospholipase family protein [Proteobacteria bacterium]|nr:patatin-like phospholipase family protein [Pseudomonadota bacterium]